MGERSINLFINVTFLFEMFEFLTTNPLKWLQKYILTRMQLCRDCRAVAQDGSKRNGFLSKKKRKNKRKDFISFHKKNVGTCTKLTTTISNGNP